MSPCNSNDAQVRKVQREFNVLGNCMQYAFRVIVGDVSFIVPLFHVEESLEMDNPTINDNFQYPTVGGYSIAREKLCQIARTAKPLSAGVTDVGLRYVANGYGKRSRSKFTDDKVTSRTLVPRTFGRAGRS